MQNARDSDLRDLAKQREGEELRLHPFFDRRKTAKDENHGENTTDPLTEQRRIRDTFYPHSEPRDEENIQSDVRERGRRKEEKRCLGIPECREDSRRYIIEKDERKPQNINIKIQFGVCEHVFRGVDQREKRIGQKISRRHQDGAEHRTRDQCRRHRALHVAGVLRAEEPRHDHRATDVAPEGKSDEDERDFITVAHRCERIVADELPRDKTVRNVVKLLEENTAEHGEAELPQYRARFPYREILVHG